MKLLVIMLELSETPLLFPLFSLENTGENLVVLVWVVNMGCISDAILPILLCGGSFYFFMVNFVIQLKINYPRTSFLNVTFAQNLYYPLLILSKSIYKLHININFWLINILYYYVSLTFLIRRSHLKLIN